MPRLSKVDRMAGAMRALSGIAKHLQPGRAYPLGGTRYTQDGVAAVYQAHLDAIQRVDAARAALDTAVRKERAAAARARDLMRYLKMHVQSSFGSSVTVWADFGWNVPKKPGPKTVKVKVEGARKVRETRVARRTMGKRQRRKLKG